MTLNLLIDNSLVKYTYSTDIEDAIKDLSSGDKIYFVYEEGDSAPIITNIINIVKKGEEELSDKTYFPSNTEVGQVFNMEDFYEEYELIDNRLLNHDSDSYTVFKSDIEDNTITFYNGLSQPIWIRNAWRATDLMESVPDIQDVTVTLITPSGVSINESNISEYGRMWVEGYIINYAIKEPEIGEYQFVYSKPKGTYLGEAGIHVMGLSGYITIDKFGANLIDRDILELVWNIGGVPDDGIEIEVYLANDKFSTLIYSGSSKEEELHIIDKRRVSVTNLPRGQYNIVVTVKDIDLKTQEDDINIAENTLVVTAETIKVTENVGVLVLQ